MPFIGNLGTSPEGEGSCADMSEEQKLKTNNKVEKKKMDKNVSIHNP